MDLSSIQFPGFKILAEVGRGATGVVYRAQDVTINRVVAIKMLILGPAAEQRMRTARFLREARVLAALMPHDNIPAIHAIMEHQGHHCHVREFVEGTTLKERVVASRINESDARQVLAGVQAAVDSMHTLGLVHRNLCPENILVAADGTSKLIGFSRAVSVKDVPRDVLRIDLFAADIEFLRSMEDRILAAVAE